MPESGEHIWISGGGVLDGKAVGDGVAGMLLGDPVIVGRLVSVRVWVTRGTGNVLLPWASEIELLRDALQAVENPTTSVKRIIRIFMMVRVP